MLIAVLTICGTASLASCSSREDHTAEQSNITNIADRVWLFSQSHPDGFTIDIRTMTEPTEGVAVSYAATQNSQHCVSILSTYTDIPVNGKVAEILDRGTILFGTTGDYRPLSFCEPDGTYWGFGIDVANEIARRLGVGIEFKKTSWPTLTADVLTEPQIFDLAIGGITVTDTRRETMLMNDGYLANGKTITDTCSRRRSRRDDNGNYRGSLLCAN